MPGFFQDLELMRQGFKICWLSRVEEVQGFQGLGSRFRVWEVQGVQGLGLRCRVERPQGLSSRLQTAICCCPGLQVSD